MLNRIEIKYFRSCHEVVLEDLGPVTVLVGRNASGKSNILRGIRWLASTATAGKDSAGSAGSGDVSLQVTLDKAVYRYSSRLEFAVAHGPDRGVDELHFTESLAYEDSEGAAQTLFNRKNEEVGLLWPQSEMRINIGALTPCMPALASLLPADSPVLGLIRPFSAFLEKIRYYPLVDDDDVADSGPLVFQKTYDEWLARNQRAGDPGTSVLLRLLHMFLTSSPQFEEIRSLLGPNGLGLLRDIRIHAQEMPKYAEEKEGTNKWYWVDFAPSPQPEEDSQFFPFKELSDGTQRVIKILVSLIFDRSGVMLLEHPEDGIHRGLLRKLIDLLRGYSDQSQLILSSHSAVVFNTLDPGAVRMVSMEKGATRVRALSQQEMGIAGKYLEEDGSLSDFLETVEDE